MTDGQLVSAGSMKATTGVYDCIRTVCMLACVKNNPPSFFEV